MQVPVLVQLLSSLQCLNVSCSPLTAQVHGDDSTLKRWRSCSQLCTDVFPFLHNPHHFGNKGLPNPSNLCLLLSGEVCCCCNGASELLISSRRRGRPIFELQIIKRQHFLGLACTYVANRCCQLCHDLVNSLADRAIIVAICFYKTHHKPAHHTSSCPLCLTGMP